MIRKKVNNLAVNSGLKLKKKGKKKKKQLQGGARRKVCKEAPLGSTIRSCESVVPILNQRIISCHVLFCSLPQKVSQKFPLRNFLGWIRKDVSK